MIRKYDGYTAHISNAERGFDIVIAKPDGDKHITHSYTWQGTLQTIRDFVDADRK